MARPLKVGIDYFPTDVDIDQDDKVKMVKNKYGLMGMGTVLMLLAKIYKNGYFYHWTEREQELFCGDYREEVNAVNNVVNECIKWGMFDKNVYEDHQVLTSIGIQKRYLLAVERRKDKHIIDDYWLIEKTVNERNKGVNVNNNSVNADNKPVNADKSTQSKVKESKKKEDIKHIVDSNECDLAFKLFWDTYPTKGSNKKLSVEKWNKLWKDKKIVNVDKVINGINDYVAFQNKKGYSICAAQVFLNQERWNVEWEDASSNQKEYVPVQPSALEHDPYLEEAYARRMGKNTGSA